MLNLEIIKPYFVTKDGLPGIDFNREIIEPGQNENFPDGAVGIRVDDDFWQVAALPYSLKDIPLKEIVDSIWPHYADKAEICPDSGTIEQERYFSEQYTEALKEQNNRLNKRVLELQFELDRFHAKRPALHETYTNRHKAESSYFIRQYEHLVVAFAHKHEGSSGICTKCNLMISDRIHMQHYIDLHNAGFKPRVDRLLSFPKEV